MKKLLVTMAAATLLATPLAAQAQDWAGDGGPGAGAPAHGGYYNPARRYDRYDRDAWTDWDTRGGWSGRDGWSYTGRWSDRDGWGNAGEGPGPGGFGAGYGYAGYGDAGDAPEDARYYPGLEDYGWRARGRARGAPYPSPRVAYGFADVEAYYSGGADAYPPDAGWGGGPPPADCGNWVWRADRGAYVWVPCPCPAGASGQDWQPEPEYEPAPPPEPAPELLPPRVPRG